MRIVIVMSPDSIDRFGVYLEGAQGNTIDYDSCSFSGTLRTVEEHLHKLKRDVYKSKAEGE